MDFLGLSDVSAVGLGTLILLLVCSIVVISVVMERLIFYKRNVVNPDFLQAYVCKYLQEGKLDDARKFVAKIGGLLPRVYEIGLARYDHPQEDSEVAMSTMIGEQRLLLERNLAIISTIAVIAPFIGLFGTVVGIMHTFTAVAEQGQAGVAVVAAGVAEALIATACGLFVAITAVVFFNFFKAKVNRITTDMVNAASHLSEMMNLARNGREFPEDLNLLED